MFQNSFWGYTRKKLGPLPDFTGKGHKRAEGPQTPEVGGSKIPETGGPHTLEVGGCQTLEVGESQTICNDKEICRAEEPRRMTL